jgi:hypothetical protein
MLNPNYATDVLVGWELEKRGVYCLFIKLGSLRSYVRPPMLAEQPGGVPSQYYMPRMLKPVSCLAFCSFRDISSVFGITIRTFAFIPAIQAALRNAD